MAFRNTPSVLVYLLPLTVFFVGGFAVDVMAQEVDDTATTTATTSAPVETDPEPWFEIDRLTGKVDIGDFVVGPGRVELEVEPGESVTTQMTVTNRVDDDRRFRITVEDIAGSQNIEESVVLLGDDRGPYSIQDYVSTPDDELTLDLGQRARIPVTISIPADAEPGGYYGSVLVETVKNDAQETPQGDVGPRSPIIARVGTLFFVTVPGDVERGGQLQEFSLTNDKWWYESGPLTFGILFENTGSVHLNPYGEIRITNMLGEEVGFTELEPWFILPESLRLREVTWDREHLLGRYTATVHLNRGYDDIVDTETVTFWVLPWKIVLGIFAVVFIISFLIRMFFRTFEFKRKG